MGLRIQTNTTAMTAQRNLRQSQDLESDSARHTSSGSRITRAGEDVAGLSVSTSLNAGIRSTQAALRNTNDGISLVQVAEGAVQSLGDMIVRLRELGIQAASDTIGDSERRMIQREVDQTRSEMDRIVNTTEFNGTKILNGSLSELGFGVQIGIHSGAPHQLGVGEGQLNFSTDRIGLSQIDFSSKESARNHLADIDTALERVSAHRATLGSIQSRFSTIASGLGSSELNLSAANSRIKDADVASETSDLAKNRILREAGTAVLTQANTQPQQALKLIG